MTYSIKEIERAIKPENFLGAGIGRATFQLDDRNVVKIPRGLFSDHYIGYETCQKAVYKYDRYSDFGATQSNKEIEVYLNFSWAFSDILCPILQVEILDRAPIIVMPKVETFGKELTSTVNDYFFNHREIDMKLRAMCIVLEKPEIYAPFAERVEKLCHKTGLENWDILDNLGNVGIYNGHLVAIDFGYEDDCGRNYYHYSYGGRE